MSKRLFVGTRKGLFTLERNGHASAWTVSSPRFLGNHVTLVLPDPRDGSIYAALSRMSYSPELWRKTSKKVVQSFGPFRLPVNILDRGC